MHRGIKAGMIVGLLAVSGSATVAQESGVTKARRDACTVSVPVRASDSENADTLVSGPVLTLDYTGQASSIIPIADFMYFVPLISPEPVTVSESPTNTLRVRVVSIRQEVQADGFSVNLVFDVSGQGFRHYAIDSSGVIRRRQSFLASGNTLKKQLDYIRLEGSGKGRLEIRGRDESGERVVTTVRLHFADRGGASPVTIGLKDVRVADGAPTFENELVARVNFLEFTRADTPPRMGVRLHSVKRRDAGDSFIQNVKGRIIGAVANMLVDSIKIRTIGNDAMLDFGRVVLDREPTFTFPAVNHLMSK
jgi:hypothetical protein